ncbi:hypothetical protein LJE71_04120 [Xanthobacter autotrophicus]|uniref:hypothetical protein n=1 Tax=Xanthobacter autotrophicus TaxID=280 RepID=UPI001E3526AF|nr:hypothetical protein [Xanthobacter autotrophicus]UDQ90202.1 hypothetical protein LJE71_04120 [Xanthobacter autotrophicus]
MVNSSRPLSLGAKLELDDFRPSGFDFLRLILALSVLVPHAATIAQGEAFGEEFFNGTFAPYFQLVLPAFFILSGFLVSGSMFRSKTLVMFAGCASFASIRHLWLKSFSRPSLSARW